MERGKVDEVKVIGSTNGLDRYEQKGKSRMPIIYMHLCIYFKFFIKSLDA